MRTDPLTLGRKEALSRTVFRKNLTFALQLSYLGSEISV